MEDLIQRVAEQILEGVRIASQEYFKWTKGNILYDGGVEFLMQAAVARRIYESFNENLDPTIHLEHPGKEFNIPGSKRIDMVIKFPTENFAIEFKRYTNECNLKDDILRVHGISQHPGHVGMIAAPCYLKSSVGEGWDWPVRVKTSYEEKGIQCLLGDCSPLSENFKNPYGWTHERPFVLLFTGSN